MNINFQQRQSQIHAERAGRWQRLTPQVKAKDRLKKEIPTQVSEQTEKEKQNIYGYIYHNGAQGLNVKMPGDVVSVRFSDHAVLSGLRHNSESSDIEVIKSGVYEILYSVRITAKDAAFVTFGVQADGKTVKGSQINRLVNTQESICCTSILTELRQLTTIRLVMTSGVAVNVELNGSGVCASFVIKKIG